MGAVVDVAGQGPSSDPAEVPALGPREKRLILGSLCLALFMVMLDGTVVNTALPKIQGDLGAGVSGLQWIVDGYVLAVAALMLTGGTLGDLFGRRRLLLSGIVIFTVGSVLCGLSPDTTTLIMARFLQGVGAAALMPGTLSILTNVFSEPSERARAIGLWAGVSGVALASGPVVGGLLADTLGWQSIFFINLPVGIIAFIVIRRVAPESSDHGGRKLDAGGQVLTVLTLAPLTFALIQGNESGWSSPLIVGAFVVAALSAVGLVVCESRTTSPMIPLQFFRNPTFSAATASGALVAFSLFGMNVYFSLYFQRVQGHTALGAGMRMLTISAVMAVMMPIAGRVTSTLGSKPVMMTGMALSGIGMISLVTVSPTSAYLTVAPRMLFVGVGMALAMPSTTAAVMASVPLTRAGMSSATLNTSRQVGNVMGVAILGALVTANIAATLGDRLASLGLEPQVREDVADAMAHGGSHLADILPVGTEEAAVRHAYGLAFVGGLHNALALSGVLLLIACTFVGLVVRRHAGLAASTPQATAAAAAAAAAH